MKFTQADAHLIEKAVERLEKKSSVEIVVVIDAKADNYKDIELLLTALFVLVGLIINLFVPWEIGRLLFLLDLILLGGFIYSFIHFSGILKWFVPNLRKKKAVLRAARAAFTGQKVYCTRARTGILIYLAIFEKDVEVIADAALHTFIPKDSYEWWIKGLDELKSSSDSSQLLIEHLERLGERLEKYLPVREDDTNEIPNAPLVNI